MQLGVIVPSCERVGLLLFVCLIMGEDVIFVFRLLPPLFSIQPTREVRRWSPSLNIKARKCFFFLLFRHPGSPWLDHGFFLKVPA